MRILNENELKTILENHKLWLINDTLGICADLYCANLRGADLSSADLSSANLRGADLSSADLYCANLSSADLSSANLRGANLRGADLYCANLSSANLRGANLRGADLYCANLSSANLSGADLSSANLRGANLRGANLYGLKKQLLDHIHKHSIVPEEGQFIGYKKLALGSIATLLIPKSAIRYGGLVGRKCRASKVKVLKIELEGKEIKKDVDRYAGKLEYQVGKWIKPDRFDDDFTKECTNGIHFFITKKEAEDY